MKDFLDREINAGDFIVYGRRDGNSSKTTLYCVVSVENKFLKARALTYNEYIQQWQTSGLSRLNNPGSVVVVRSEDVPQEAKDRYTLLTTNNPSL